MNKEPIKQEDLLHYELLTIAQLISNSKLQWYKEGREIIHTPNAIFTIKERNVLKRLFILPMPPEFRKEYWLIASGARREMRNHPHYYSNLSQLFPKDIPSPYENQIEVDLVRTCPSDPFFKDNANLTMMRNILLAYSRRSVTIGYCQGFNFIVSRILKLYQSEEETFWVFTQIIESLLPPNYFCELAEMMADCTVLTHLIEANEPMLIEHLKDKDAEIYLNNSIYRWFMSLFIHNTHELLWLAIWDIFMLEGNIVLFKAPIALLKLGMNDLLKAQTGTEIQNIFINKLQLKNNVKYLLYYLLVKRFNFNMSTINQSRAQILPKVIEEIKGNRDLKVNTNGSKIIPHCNPKWPLCMMDENFRYQISQCFIYKQLDKPFIVKNYFDFLLTNKRTKSQQIAIDESSTSQFSNELNSFNQIIIERRRHLCQLNVNSINEPKSKYSNSKMPNIENEDRDEKEMTSLMKTLTEKSKQDISSTLLNDDLDNSDSDNDNNHNNDKDL